MVGHVFGQPLSNYTQGYPDRQCRKQPYADHSDIEGRLCSATALHVALSTCCRHLLCRPAAWLGVCAIRVGCPTQFASALLFGIVLSAPIRVSRHPARRQCAAGAESLTGPGFSACFADSGCCAAFHGCSSAGHSGPHRAEASLAGHSPSARTTAWC